MEPAVVVAVDTSFRDKWQIRIDALVLPECRAASYRRWSRT
jgi:hypothetical protein